MATANKLAVLQKIKQEKCFLFGSFSNDLTKNLKNCTEVTELAEPPRLTVVVRLRHSVGKADPDFVGPKRFTSLGALFNKNNAKL